MKAVAEELVEISKEDYKTLGRDCTEIKKGKFYARFSLETFKKLNSKKQTALILAWADAKARKKDIQECYKIKPR